MNIGAVIRPDIFSCRKRIVTTHCGRIRNPPVQSCIDVLIFQFLIKIIHKLLDLNALLLHGVTVADGNAAVLFKRVEIVGNAERRSYLVLTAVALAYLSRLVVLYGEVL